MRPEFKSSIKRFEMDYITKSAKEKEEIKKSLLNQLIDPLRYKAVWGYSAGSEAVDASRRKVHAAVSETPPASSRGNLILSST